MNILFELKHPSDVHLYKHIIRKLSTVHNVFVYVSNREDIVTELLDLERIPYHLLHKNPGGLIERGIVIVRNANLLRRIIHKNKVDISTGQASIPLGFSAIGNDVAYIAFTDSEPTPWNIIPSLLFSEVLFTPEAFTIDLGHKHKRIKSYKELAYLHPNWYTPDLSVYEELGIEKNEKYALFRFSAFDATHDIKRSGFTDEQKAQLITRVEQECKVFISSEIDLPQKFREYIPNISKNKMHDLIYYSELLIADSQTSAVEAACLGVPVIRSNSFVGANDLGNVKELDERYGLLNNIRPFNRVISMIDEILMNKNYRMGLKQKLKRLYHDKVDLSQFFIDLISNYPSSLDEIYLGA